METQTKNKAAEYGALAVLKMLEYAEKKEKITLPVLLSGGKFDNSTRELQQIRRLLFNAALDTEDTELVDAVGGNPFTDTSTWWRLLETSNNQNLRINLTYKARTKDQVDALLEKESRKAVLYAVVQNFVLNEDQLKVVKRNCNKSLGQKIRLDNVSVERTDVYEAAKHITNEEKLLYFAVGELTPTQEKELFENLRDQNLSREYYSGLHNSDVLFTLKPNVSLQMLTDPKAVLVLTQSKNRKKLLRSIVTGADINFTKHGTVILQNIMDKGLRRIFANSVVYNFHNTGQDLKKLLKNHDLENLLTERSRENLNTRIRENLHLQSRRTDTEAAKMLIMVRNGALETNSLREGLLSLFTSRHVSDRFKAENLSELATLLGKSRDWCYHYILDVTSKPVEFACKQAQVNRNLTQVPAWWKPALKTLKKLPKTKEAYSMFVKLLQKGDMNMKQAANVVLKI